MPIDPPADAICIEPGCDYPATTTRPNLDPWLTDTGIITHCDEWVCAIHAPACTRYGAHILSHDSTTCIHCGTHTNA